MTIEYGQIWQLGNHRLMCGDATLKEDIDKLLDGEKATLCFTDPPYGVNAVEVKRNIVGGTGSLLRGKEEDTTHRENERTHRGNGSERIQKAPYTNVRQGHGSGWKSDLLECKELPPSQTL